VWVRGALRFSKTPNGGEKLLAAASSHKCLIQLEDVAAESEREEVVARYFLKQGVQVIVYLGDITKQEADALVNAANEDLRHSGGVALALSKAAGPEVQRESSDLVRRDGKVATGDAVMTSGGKLKCKKLLHAVGPEKDKAGGRERELQVVQGDIIHEKTDVIVNSTGFKSEPAGVSKAILTAAGPPVQAELFNGQKHKFIYIHSGLLGCKEIVHVQTDQEAQATNKTCKKVLKLCESKGFTSAAFPAINTGTNFKKVEVDPNSVEYQDIAKGFHKTAKYKIHKIERVQNYHLWSGYFVMRRKMEMKNSAAELGEKYLYHGTSAESCHCIERDRFDRNYTGAHGASYGAGVYFAINASYSANSRYAKPDPAGLKRMYVARVLTGHHTLGDSSMKSPPQRGDDPSDKYDSLVDNLQSPSMYVIFHDDQAYPEYLITFI
uniref:Poly [ADP-ribose] polymerase n=1 Tax=Neogobius melanostomus TaxID=47308 RepID=A0A8C6T8J7_9GOBI